jgi:uncharacterized protein (TIGR03084 family)
MTEQTDYRQLLDDLRVEGDALDAVVADLDPSLATAAPGWTVAHQIGHLEWTDRNAALSLTDPELFSDQAAALGDDPGPVIDAAAETEAARPWPELLDEWRAARAAVLDGLAAHDPDDRVPWFGPSLTAESQGAARLMETFAHGHDIREALGLPVAVTGRLWPVADLGVRTRNFAYRNRGLQPPSEHFRIDLMAADGVRTWGPEDATDRISGTLEDFLLLVTRRAHPDDLTLKVTGDRAQEWIGLAQIYVGSPGAGREPRNG